MEQNTYRFLLSEAAEQYKSSAWQYGAGAFAQIAGGLINYAALNTGSKQYKLQAKSIELQALERANQLRQELLQAYGNYQYSAAARGISISSGSVQDNLRNSSENFGQDIQKMTDSANAQAGALRTTAKIAKIRATGALFGGLAGSAESFGDAYKSYQTAKRLNNG